MTLNEAIANAKARGLCVDRSDYDGHLRVGHLGVWSKIYECGPGDWRADIDGNVDAGDLEALAALMRALEAR